MKKTELKMKKHLILMIVVLFVCLGLMPVNALVLLAEVKADLETDTSPITSGSVADATDSDTIKTTGPYPGVSPGLEKKCDGDELDPDYEECDGNNWPGGYGDDYKPLCSSMSSGDVISADASPAPPSGYCSSCYGNCGVYCSENEYDEKGKVIEHGCEIKVDICECCGELKVGAVYDDAGNYIDSEQCDPPGSTAYFDWIPAGEPNEHEDYTCGRLLGAYHWTIDYWNYPICNDDCLGADYRPCYVFPCEESEFGNIEWWCMEGISFRMECKRNTYSTPYAYFWGSWDSYIWDCEDAGLVCVTDSRQCVNPEPSPTP